jgi:hypothetical protein
MFEGEQWEEANSLSPDLSGVKPANCLIKNLLESESLPQIRNLLEMREINPARLRLKSGVKPGSGLLTDDDQAGTISRVDIVTIAVNLNGEEAES